MSKMIVVHEERCLGCRSCVLECAVAHSRAGDLVEALQAGEKLQSRVHIEPFKEFGMPLQCRHCEDAPCQAICPTEAIHRPSEKGPVLIEAERCIGCKYCLVVCPFGIIQLSRDGKAVVKCDLCIDRTEAGEEPACVTACPTGALEFVELDDLLREQRRNAVEVIARVRDKKNATSESGG